MSRHEIEIEGLPEGWTPVSLKSGLSCEDGAILPDGTATVMCTLIVRRKVRKYRWEITLPDVLVAKSPQHVVFGLLGHQPPDAGMVIAPIWQPNIHGKCPVDGEACWVRVRCSYGHEHEGLASSFNWDSDLRQYITAYQFIRLADGWEWA